MNPRDEFKAMLKALPKRMREPFDERAFRERFLHKPDPPWPCTRCGADTKEIEPGRVWTCPACGKAGMVREHPLANAPLDQRRALYESTHMDAAPQESGR